MQYKPPTSTFSNTQHCWQHYLTHPFCQPIRLSRFIFLNYRQKYLKYIEIVKFNLMTSQLKSMRTPVLKNWVKTQVCCSCLFHKGKCGGTGTAQLRRATRAGTAKYETFRTSYPSVAIDY